MAGRASTALNVGDVEVEDFNIMKVCKDPDKNDKEIKNLRKSPLTQVGMQKQNTTYSSI